MHPQSPETEIELQPHQQKSLESEIAAAANSCGTDIQSTEKSTKISIIYVMLYLLSLRSFSCTAGESQSEEIDAAQSTSAQATDIGTYYVATKV